MDISKLDEWQGVTPQLVTDWLLKNGWMQTKPRWWERGEDAFTFDSATFDQLWFWTHALAAIYTNGNVQALIREINPRMRKGVPSGAAITAHEASGGHWLAKSAESGGVLRVLLFSTKDAAAKLQALDTTQRLACIDIPLSWFFWPCDEHGNKVRWPEKDGVML